MAADPNKRYAEALGPQRVSPVLLGLQFAAAHNKSVDKATPDNQGGSTMNVHTGRMVGKETPGYGVGGSKSERTGKGVPTDYGPRYLTTAHGVEQTMRIRKEFPTNEHANVGSWVNPDTMETEFDASEVVNSLPMAHNLARQRGEKAIFDFQNLRDIKVK